MNTSRTSLAVATAAFTLCLSAFSAPASAFCGFYVAGDDADLYANATMVVMMREGTRTALSMQNDYEGPTEDFAMVIPVPIVLQEENVKTLPHDVFNDVLRLSSPRLVEYWERDPCASGPDPRMVPRPSAVRRSARGMSGSGGGPAVVVEAEFSVGEYDIVILSARESGALQTWLTSNGYNIPDGAAEVLRPYVEQGMKFFVAKVDASKVTFEAGQARLSPLRVHYDTDTFSLPIRLGLLNSAGAQDLIVHILARNQRYEVANYDNVYIPTNLDVTEATRERFGEFYGALFEETLREHPGAVVTEYAWNASSCDPCPGGVSGLSQQRIMQLGADVMQGAGLGAGPTPRPGRGMGVTPPGLRRPPRRIRRGRGGYVLTRLHHRYTAESLGEDLVFRPGAAVMGGREQRDESGDLSSSATPSGVNNFQGRYAIRHPWTGPITCDNPQRGRWGGPPNGPHRPGRGGPTAATPPRRTGRVGSASAPSSSFLVSTAEAQAAQEPPTTASEDAVGSGGELPPPSGCGCHVARSRSETPAGLVLLVLGLAWLRTRRRETPHR